MSTDDSGIPSGHRRPADARPAARLEAGQPGGGPGDAAVRILLLTGDRGAGKSTLCERLAEEAERLGIPVGGVACPAAFGPDGNKVGCRVRDLASGAERELGSTVRDLGGPRWKGWSFSETGFEEANRAVLAALDRGPGLVILDEVGPLELRLGAGLEPSLGALDRMLAEENRAGSGGLPPDSPAETLVLMVVRPELAEELARRYPGAATIRIEPGERRAALDLAREALFRTPSP